VAQKLSTCINKVHVQLLKPNFHAVTRADSLQRTNFTQVGLSYC